MIPIFDLIVVLTFGNMIIEFPPQIPKSDNSEYFLRNTIFFSVSYHVAMHGISSDNPSMPFIRLDKI
jgi:hypothetical protein